MVPEYGGKKAYQSQVDFGDGKIFLLNAIVDDKVEPAIVVTVYRSILFSNATIEESDEEKPGMILDYDKEGNIVGLEILDASKVPNVPSQTDNSPA